MLFADLPLPDVFRDALDERGYLEATPVQREILDPRCAGRDVLVSSRTGSGKTIAFGLAIADVLLAVDVARRGAARPPRALVIAPTRELALQVARELTWLTRKAAVRIATCVGGMDFGREARALKDGVDVVVGTPGRLVDHLTRGTLSLAGIAAVVLDEADEMLDMGFRDELEALLDATPSERRTLLFSATLPKDIVTLAERYTRDAVRVEATASGEAHGDITTLGHLVAPAERFHAVVNVLRLHDPPSALVFCATRDAVARLHAGLVERGFAAVALSGEMSQAERNRALQAMRDGRARVMVATDVAARGLDLPAVALVVHADLPHDAAVLQHRSGRTGRAGRRGTAVVLAPFPARRRAEALLRAARVEGGWTSPPSADEVRTLDRERALLTVGAHTTDLDDDDLAEGRLLLERFDAVAIAAALLRVEKRAFPAPEELPLTLTPPSRRGAVKDRARTGRAEVDDEVMSTTAPPPRARGREAAWFHVNVGRQKNADPRWLLPLLCRRGNVKKSDIGRIEIEERATFFEVNPGKADAFAAAARKPDEKDPQVRITRARGR